MRRGDEHDAGRTSPRLLLLGFATFVGVHVILHAWGVRYQAPLDRYWEYVDPALLRTRLLESLFYLHSQPPLFNLFLGVILKLFPSGATTAFHATYLLAGLALYLGVLALMRRLHVSPALAFAAATAFAVGPAFVLYEHQLFYMVPIALLVVLSHLLLYEGLVRGGTTPLVAFFALIAVLCALQSVFHVVYYVAVLAAVLALCPRDRGRALRAGLLPFLALALLYVKNLVLFGIFTTSSWSGMHFADMTVDFLPSAQRARLVADGELSPVSLVLPFSPLDAYPARYRATPPWADRIPVLSATRTSADRNNYHHLAYLEISRRYAEDARRTALARPWTVARALVRSWAAYFKPASDYFALEPNRSRLGLWRRVYVEGLGGQALWPTRWSPRPDRPAVSLLLVLPAVFAFGAVAAVRGRVGPTALTTAQRAVVGLMCVTIAYVALVVNSLTAGENNRFRFVTDPLSVCLLALLVGHWLRRRSGAAA